MFDAIDALIQREGGYTNRPTDRGGPTKYGITQRTLAAYRGHPVTAEDVQALTHGEARAIYIDEYLVAPHLDQIPDDTLREMVLDIAVMSGPATAIALLQHCLHDEHGQALIVDGVFGPNTRRALLVLDAAEPLQTQLVRRRVLQLVGIVRDDPTQLEYLAGWITRTLDWLPGVRE